MFFQALTRIPPNRLITRHCLRNQTVLTEPFAAHDNRSVRDGCFCYGALHELTQYRNE